jgi:hypothetical protein
VTGDELGDILRRIEREANVPGLVAVLAERLSPTDLTSLLLEVYRRRAAARAPRDLLVDHADNRFCRPAVVDARSLAEWDRLAFAALPSDFDVVELSPLAPLGVCSVVATVSQHRVVSTTRGVEVLSDGSNVLALECALRRRAGRNSREDVQVKLAASARVVRAQQFEGARSFAHFRLFHLCSAGRDSGSSRFVIDALVEHVGIQLTALRAFLGDAVPLRVALTDLATHESSEPFAERLMTPLRRDHIGVDVVIDQERESGRGYYRSVCFKLFARVADEWLDIGDGGDVDWMEKLLSDRRERLFISGVGSERVAALPGELPSA